MTRTFTLFCLCLFTNTPNGRADPPKTEDPAPKLPAALARSVTLGGRRIDGIQLNDALRVLSDKHQLTLALDDAEFEKKGIKEVGQKKISLPKIANAPAGMIAEMIARQVDGTIRLDGDKLTIVPGKARDVKTLVGPPNPAIVGALTNKVTLEKPIGGSPLKDILDFLSDKYGPTIVVDEWAFAKAGTKNVSDTQCSLPAHTVPLGGLLVVLAGMVKGEVVVGNELVLIVPAAKK